MLVRIKIVCILVQAKGGVRVDIGQNIRQLRALFDLTQTQVAEITGVTSAAVSNWENGESKPRMGRLQDLADHLGLPLSVLIDGGGIDRIDPVTRKLRRPSRAVEPEASTTAAPVYGRIAAGKPIASLPVEDTYWVPPDVLAAHPRAFYLRVEGESMNRVLPDGCLALVDPDAEVSSGDVAAVNVNGYDATVKRVLLGSTSITLAPDSTDEGFTDTIFDRTKPGTDTVTLIGRVVWSVVPYGR
jgi:repressor LexA